MTYAGATGRSPYKEDIIFVFDWCLIFFTINDRLEGAGGSCVSDKPFYIAHIKRLSDQVGQPIQLLLLEGRILKNR